jgi:hypothetical protein
MCGKNHDYIEKSGGQYVGGTIDNSALDQAITDDLIPRVPTSKLVGG